MGVAAGCFPCDLSRSIRDVPAVDVDVDVADLVSVGFVVESNLRWRIVGYVGTVRVRPVVKGIQRTVNVDWSKPDAPAETPALKNIVYVGLLGLRHSQHC